LEYLRYLLHEHKSPIAVDIETTTDSHIDIIGLADSPLHAVSYNFFSSNKQPRVDPRKELEIWYLLAKVLQSKELIFQNGMYDATVLMHHNQIFAAGYKYDIMIAAHCCWPEARRSLAFLSSICLNVPKWKHQSQSAPTLYNASDAANTYGVWNTIEPEMERLGVRSIFDFEMLQVWPSMMMQLQGLHVNKDRQREMIKSVNQRITELKTEIKNDTGKEINLNSPQQLKALLYIDMKLPIQYKRGKSRHDDRKMTTDNEAMRKLKRLVDNPLLDKIIEYKKLTKLLTFIDIQTSPEGKVHTSYNVTGATMQRSKGGAVIDDDESYKSFGRWSSSKSIIIPYGSGNLQNIPKKARIIYEPPPGHCILQADYIQAEAVVVAYLIRDEVLMKMFKDSFGLSREERKEKNYDLHKMTAAQMFGLDINEVTPEQRRKGKTLRHASNYSAGPAVVANQLDCNLTDAKALLQQYHNSCPQLKLWHREIEKELYRSRTLTNLLGRKHKFTDRWGESLFRSAYSYIPQSTVGDLLNTALVRLYNRYGSELLIGLQLHDAIYTFPKNDEESILQAKEWMEECMLMPLRAQGEEFYIDVDFSLGMNWKQMTEL
jgi:DNA polymerase-1